MSIDEKVQAVEEFLAWREENEPTTPPVETLTRWAYDLERARLQEAVDAIRERAAQESSSLAVFIAQVLNA